MSSSLYLRRNRFGVFLYRRRIPEAARVAFDGRREIVRSLATTRRQDAIPLAQALNLAVEQQIRKALAHSMPERSSLYYLVHPEEFTKDVSQPLADLQQQEQFKEKLRNGFAAAFAHQQAPLKDGVDGKFEPDATPEATQASNIEAPSAERSSTSTSASALSMRELCNRFIKDEETRIGDKMVPNYYTFLDRLADLAPGPVPEFDRECARQIREQIANYPKNIRTAKYQKLSATQILEIVDEDEARLSAKSINNHLDLYTRLFAFALQERYHPGPTNPFAGLKLRQTKTSDREPFTEQELGVIYQLPIFQGSTEHVHGYRPNRYWIPLILYTSGARRSEAACLYVEDIKQDDAGIWYYDHNEKTPDKRKKQPSSVRKTPIHPILIKLGFLDYVAALKDEGQERLFPELRYNKRNGYAKAFGEGWFNPQLKDLGINKTAHHFRHTFRTLASQYRLPLEHINAMAGWEDSGANTGQKVYDHYEFTMTELRESLLLIEFKALDLAKPFPMEALKERSYIDKA
jgi:integrase